MAERGEGCTRASRRPNLRGPIVISGGPNYHGTFIYTKPLSLLGVTREAALFPLFHLCVMVVRRCVCATPGRFGFNLRCVWRGLIIIKIITL